MKFLEKLKQRKIRKHLKRLEKLERAPEKIRLRYPRYEVGVGTYGIPEVMEFGDNTILKVGSYTSIAEGVKILLGGGHRTDWVSTYPFPLMIDEARDIPGCSPTKGDVVIGSDCWICADVMILSGVTHRSRRGGRRRCRRDPRRRTLCDRRRQPMPPHSLAF